MRSRARAVAMSAVVSGVLLSGAAPATAATYTLPDLTCCDYGVQSMRGNGVTVTSIDRLRDPLADLALRAA